MPARPIPGADLSVMTIHLNLVQEYTHVVVSTHKSGTIFMEFMVGPRRDVSLFFSSFIFTKSINLANIWQWETLRFLDNGTG